MQKVNVKVVNLSKGHNPLPLPKYATYGDDAVDLMACFDSAVDEFGHFYSIINDYAPDNKNMDFMIYENDEYVLNPGHRAIVPTGLVMELPIGKKLSVKSRSGLSIKNGVRCENSPGTVDATYRGGVGVILINDSKVPFKIKHGDRVAQGAIEDTQELVWNPCKLEDLSDTERGDGGYGHTGTNSK